MQNITYEFHEENIFHNKIIEKKMGVKYPLMLNYGFYITAEVDGVVIGIGKGYIVNDIQIFNFFKNDKFNDINYLHMGLLCGVYVEKEYRGLNIAKVLTEKRTEFIFSKGITKIRTTVRENSSLYKSNYYINSGYTKLKNYKHNKEGLVLFEKLAS